MLKNTRFDTNDCLYIILIVQTKIVHDVETESAFSRRSSLNTEEKHLFDELQNELMSLKRVMRTREEDASKKVYIA